MCPRYANKTDQNQSDIVRALQKIGCSVRPLTQVKGGVPDLLVGFRGLTYLVECKNEDGRNRIEDSQKRFADEWRGGPILYARGPKDAVDQIVLGDLQSGRPHS